jgi:hypothetical protein
MEGVMTGETKLCGVVAVLISPDGHVVGRGSNFDGDFPAGFTLCKAQTMRAEAEMRRDFIVGACNGYVSSAMQDYDIQQLVRRLKGFRTEIIKIGHDDDR